MKSRRPPVGAFTIPLDPIGDHFVARRAHWHKQLVLDRLAGLDPGVALEEGRTDQFRAALLPLDIDVRDPLTPENGVDRDLLLVLEREVDPREALVMHRCLDAEHGVGAVNEALNRDVEPCAIAEGATSDELEVRPSSPDHDRCRLDKVRDRTRPGFEAHAADKTAGARAWQCVGVRTSFLARGWRRQLCSAWVVRGAVTMALPVSVCNPSLVQH